MLPFLRSTGMERRRSWGRATVRARRLRPSTRWAAVMADATGTPRGITSSPLRPLFKPSCCAGDELSHGRMCRGLCGSFSYGVVLWQISQGVQKVGHVQNLSTKILCDSLGHTFECMVISSLAIQGQGRRAKRVIVRVLYRARGMTFLTTNRSFSSSPQAVAMSTAVTRNNVRPLPGQNMNISYTCC